MDVFLIDDAEPLETHLQQKVDAGLKERSYFLIVTASTVKLVSRSRLTVAPKERQRGRMGLMSTRSKNRLLYKCNLIDWNAVGRTSFLTLTFPDDKWPVRASKRTMLRSWFMREFEKHVGAWQPSLWRQEWEVRKTGERKGTYVSHYHIILPKCPWVDKWWIKETWMGILGETDNADTDIVEVKGIDAVIRYLASYLSSLSSLDIVSYLNTEAEFGRPWGFTREEQIPLLPILYCRSLDVDQVAVVAEMVRGVRRDYDPEKDGGFTLLGRFFSAMALTILSDTA